MIFKELVLENFGPYHGKNIINLTAKNELDNAPIILFGGMNGGGKTTLLDSIRLALYGKRSDFSNRENLSYNDYLLQCVNNQIFLGDKTRIELTFEHLVNDRWIELKIVRYWDKNIKDGKDNLAIIEGELIDLNLTENWDEYVENFLPLGISNLFLFDGEQVKELAEQDLPNSAIKEAMKSLLGLELTDKLVTDLDVLINRKDKVLDLEIAGQKFSDVEQELFVLEEQKKHLLEELAIEENQLKIVNKKFRQASNNLKDEGGKIAAQKHQLREKQKSLENDIETLSSDLRYMASQSFPLTFIPNLLKNLTIKLEEESTLLQIKNSQDLLNKNNDKLLSFMDSLDINQDAYNKIQNFLQSESLFLKQQLNSHDIYLKAHEMTLPKLNNILQNILPNQQNKVQEKLVKLAQFKEELIDVEEVISRVDSPQAYQKLEKEYNHQQKALVNVKMKCENIKETLNAVERKIVVVTKKISNYGDDNLKNLQQQHIVEMMPKVKQTLNLFQQKLTLRKLNKLESEVTNCFRYLLHKSNFVAKVAIDADNFALSLYDHHGLIIPKNRLSAGEKQLLAIGLLWGLARVSGRNLPIAIDTPLGRLDSSHRYNLIERYFPTASHQVILLSTDTEIGESEVNFLRDKQAIALEYLLDYDDKINQTTVKSGYFF